MGTEENFRSFNCIRIYYTFENLSPRYYECDFSISFKYSDDRRNIRLPFYVLDNEYYDHLSNISKKEIDVEAEIAKKENFCCMVVSNPNCGVRNNFFNKLSKYKMVHSGGKHLNNIGGPVSDKLSFMKSFKFNICFENSSTPGYTTEKILHSFSTPLIPIYWGNPLINYEFNPKSFFNYHEYDNEDALIEDIIIHDQDPEKYYKKFIEPCFYENVPNQYFDLQRIRKFLVDIIESRESYTPLAQSKFKKYIYHGVGHKLNVIKGKILKW